MTAPQITWAERELAEIVRIVQPQENEDAITQAMMLIAIRRMMEADHKKYLDLVQRCADGFITRTNEARKP